MGVEEDGIRVSTRLLGMYIECQIGDSAVIKEIKTTEGITSLKIGISLVTVWTGAYYPTSVLQFPQL